MGGPEDTIASRCHFRISWTKRPGRLMSGGHALAWPGGPPHRGVPYTLYRSGGLDRQQPRPSAGAILPPLTHGFGRLRRCDSLIGSADG